MGPDGFAMLPCLTPGVEAVSARSRHVFGRHSHDQFGIGVILAGAQAWRSGRAQVEAGAGAAISVDPGEMHDGAPIGEAGRSWRILYFDPAMLTAVAQEAAEAPLAQLEIARPVIGACPLAPRLLELFALETAPASDALRREELLLAIVAEAAAVRRARPRAIGRIGRALARIDDDPAAAVSLAELAALTGLSRFQVLRAFVRTTGFTPHAYLVQRRIDLVRRLLRGGAGLAAASAMAGFADQSHMTRTFVRKYGVTPGAYARGVSSSARTTETAACAAETSRQ